MRLAELEIALGFESASCAKPKYEKRSCPKCNRSDNVHLGYLAYPKDK